MNWLRCFVLAVAIGVGLARDAFIQKEDEILPVGRLERRQLVEEAVQSRRGLKKNNKKKSKKKQQPEEEEDYYFYEEYGQDGYPKAIYTIQQLQTIFEYNEPTIPTEIGFLTGVTLLNLLDQVLTGTIPTEIGLLKELTWIDLRNTELTGTIPTEIGNLKQLHDFYVSGSQITGTIPTEFGHLKKLTYAFFEHMPLTGKIPTEFGLLSDSLAELRLTELQLTGTIPSVLGQLTKLYGLELGANKLSGTIPTELTQLSELSMFTLDSNELTGSVPDGFGNFPYLYYFWMDHNRLHGSIPNDFGNLLFINELDFSHNQITGTIPSSFGNLLDINYLVFDHNHLNGTIPEEITNLHKLDVLAGEGNQLTGPIPGSIGDMQSLKGLYLASNKLSGGIPSSISRLTGLRELSVSNNLLNDTMPEDIGLNMTKLLVLDIEDNMLHGTLPASIANMTDLVHLSLTGNRFSGTIPENMHRLSQLKFFAAGENRFTGMSIMEITELESLEVLDLHDNMIHATLPDAIDKLRQLQVLDLHNNRFEGTVPKLLKSLAAISTLDLSNNSFVGSIPDTLVDLYHLEELNLGSNRLVGTIPDSLGYMENIKRLELQDNMLTSTIPSSLAGLRKLTLLDLSNNMLTGGVPVDIAKRFDPKAIKLSGNQLTGSLEGAPGTAPRNVRVSLVGEEIISLNWETPVSTSGWDMKNFTYVVRVFQGRANMYNLFNTLETNSTSIIVQNLDPDMVYQVQLRVVSRTHVGGWSDFVQVSTLKRCPLGQERTLGQNGQYVCMECREGYYRDSLNLSNCLPCPESFPETNGTGTDSQWKCLSSKGWITVMKTSMLHDLQQPPQGVQRSTVYCGSTSFADMVSCDEIGMSVQTLKVKPGNWRIGFDSLDIRECPMQQYCRPDSGADNGETYCSKFHTGTMCLSCVEGYAIKDGRCASCTKNHISKDLINSSVLGILLSILLLVPSFYLLKKSKSSESSCTDKLREWINIDPRLKHDLTVLLRIGLGFFQVFIQFGITNGFFGLESEWLTVVTGLDFSWLYKALETGCVVNWNFYNTLFLYTISPIVCILMMGLVVVLYTRPCKPEHFPHVLALFVWIVLQLCFLIYPGVSSTIFRTFLFDEITHRPDDDFPHRTLLADHRIDFFSDESENWRIYAFVMLFVYPVGIAVLFFAMVNFYDKVSRKPGSDLSDAELEVAQAVSFLSRPYHYEWFECYELLRKLMLTSIFILIVQASEVIGRIMFLAMGILYWIILKELKPYKEYRHYRFAEFSSALIVIMGFVGLVPLCMETFDKRNGFYLLVGLGCIEILMFLIVVITFMREKSSLIKQPSGGNPDDSNSLSDDSVDTESSINLVDPSTNAVNPDSQPQIQQVQAKPILSNV